jgi:cell division protein FtsN
MGSNHLSRYVSVPSRAMPFFAVFVAVALWLFPCVTRVAFGDDGLYGIQVGAYREKGSAVKEVNELKRLGHQAFFRHESVGSKGKWYRVYIASYDAREKAEKEGRILKDLGLISKYAVRPISEAPQARAGEKDRGPLACFLHVSSFKEKVNAEKTVARLKGRGQKAFLVREVIAGEDWYRVYIGEFENEKAAREVGSGLREKGIISYFKPVIIDRKALTTKAGGNSNQ